MHLIELDKIDELTIQVQEIRDNVYLQSKIKDEIIPKYRDMVSFSAYLFLQQRNKEAVERLCSLVFDENFTSIPRKIKAEVKTKV